MFIKLLVTIFTYIVLFSFVIRTRISIKKSGKKREERRKKDSKKEVKRIESRGYVAGCIIANFRLYFQVGGNLYSSNFISFEHIKPLGLQYRSLP